jgi:hypothetical protein
MKRPQTVFVVNNSGQDFRDQFDGEAFLFPADAKQAVEIPVEAATLIFGFGEESKLRCLQRLGWAPTSKDTQGAIERLGKFSFHLEAPNDDHSTAPVVSAGGASEPKGPAAPSSHEASVPATAGGSLLGKLAAAGASRPAA